MWRDPVCGNGGALGTLSKRLEQNQGAHEQMIDTINAGDIERAATWWHDRVRAAHKMVIPGLAPPRILELTQ